MRRSIAFVGLVAMLGAAGCGGTPAATAGATAPAAASAPAVVSPPAGQGPASSASASSAPAAASSAPATAASPSAGGTTPPQPERPCTSADLTARITSWEGAMGSQIANVQLANASAAACLLQGTPRLQLVDKAGHVLLDSKVLGAAGLPHVSPGDKALLVAPGGSATTMVQTQNYCGATVPVLPTTIAFDLPSDGGRVVAVANPSGGVPGCLGNPGSDGSIAMNGWAQ